MAHLGWRRLLPQRTEAGSLYNGASNKYSASLAKSSFSACVIRVGHWMRCALPASLEIGSGQATAKLIGREHRKTALDDLPVERGIAANIRWGAGFSTICNTPRWDVQVEGAATW